MGMASGPGAAAPVRPAPESIARSDVDLGAAAPAASVGAASIAPSAFGLAEWMRVLRAASVVVGVDTGLLYLAAAVGTPAVAIYTGSSPHSVEFESAGPWRSLGESGQQPAVADVLRAAQAVLAAGGGPLP